MNTADLGGGLYNDGAGIYLSHSIVAGNTTLNAGTPFPDAMEPSSGVPMQGLGPNLIGSCNTATLGGYRCGLTGTFTENPAPGLLALALNAPGTTMTHALGAGSPALSLGATTAPNSAAVGSCELSDQRGVPRPPSCDVGAYQH